MCEGGAKRRSSVVRSMPTVAYMQQSRYIARMASIETPTRLAADDVAVNALVPESDRTRYDAKVAALVARNATLELIETQRGECRMSKKELADRAGLDASAVRKLLTARTANPTSENVFRLFGALGIHVEAVMPSGKRVFLV